MNCDIMVSLYFLITAFRSLFEKNNDFFVANKEKGKLSFATLNM